MFDIVYIGHYTQDTIIYPHETKLQDGGAFFYGLNVIARMGLKSAVITNLARQDWHVVEDLERLGVTAFARESEHSTCLDLIYPTTNLDERTIKLKSQADPITVAQIENIDARAFIIGASLRGEVRRSWKAFGQRPFRFVLIPREFWRVPIRAPRKLFPPLGSVYPEAGSVCRAQNPGVTIPSEGPDSMCRSVYTDSSELPQQ